MRKYDSYVNRMKKVAIFKNFVVKFRVLIISFISLIVVLTTGFLATKGLVIENVTLPTDIQYGQEIKINASSVLFSNQRYQYREKGSEEWTDEMPSEPGEYEIRVVTEKSFGKVGYSDPVSFEIKPKVIDLNILDNNVVYGENPDEFSMELINNHKLLEDNLTFEYTTFASTNSQVKVNKDSIVIVDENGKDVTSFYNIETPYKDITFVNKEIVISPVGAIKDYDGLAFDYTTIIDDSTISSLIEGDTITFDVEVIDSNNNVLQGMPTNIGTYTLRVIKDSVKIINPNGENVTVNYGREYTETTLVINPRPITIKTESDSKVYDGKPLLNQNYSINEGNLLAGHELASVPQEFLSVTNVDIEGIDNEFVIDIIDSNTKESVASLYNISYIYGKLRVTPEEVSVSLDELTKPYDGTRFTYEDIENYLNENYYQHLPDGMAFVVKDSNIDKLNYHVSESPFFAELGVIDSQGNDVTNNFKSVIASEGVAKITPKYIYITLIPMKDVTFGDEIITDPQGFVFNSVLPENDLADGETLNIAYRFYTDTEEEIDPYYVGTYNVAIDLDNTRIAVSVGNTEAIEYFKTSDYTIHYDPITLNIVNRPIEFDGALDINKVFDNKNITNEYLSDELNNLLNNLPEGTKIEVVNSNANNFISAGEYAFEVNVIIKDENNKNITENFVSETTTINGQINISEIVLSFDSIFEVEKIYDTNAFDVSEIEKLLNEFAGAQLPEGLTFKFDETTALSLESSINHTMFALTPHLSIVDANGNDLTDNFKNTHGLEMSVAINQREINIDLLENYGTDGFVYGSTTAYPNNENNYENILTSNVIEGHRVLVAVLYSNDNYNSSDMPNNVGEYTVAVNANDTTILDAEGNDVTENYSIINNDSKVFEVKPFELHVELDVGGTEFVYDGKGYNYQTGYGNFISSDVLPYGEQIEISALYHDGITTDIPENSDLFTSEIRTEVGTYMIAANPVGTVLNLDGTTNDSTNYKIICETKSFTITRREIHINLYDYLSDSEDPEKVLVYDGNTHTYANYANNFEYTLDTPYTVADDQLLTVGVTYSLDGDVFTSLPTDYGLYKISIDLENTNIINSNNDVIDLDNYNIICEQDSPFVISKKEITIELADIPTRQYNGDFETFEVDGNNYNINNSEALVSQETLAVAIKFYKDAALTEEVDPFYVGTYYYALDKEASMVYKPNNNSPVSLDNYEIKTNTPYKEFVITPRDVYISITGNASDANNEKVYDNTSSDINGSYTLNNENELLKDDTLSITINYFKSSDNSISDAINVDTYKLALDTFTVLDSENKDITENYNVMSTNDYTVLFNVTPRPITFVTFDATKVYDGTPLTDLGYTIEGDGLAPNANHKEVRYDGIISSIANVDEGEVINEAYFTIEDENGDDVSYNYSIMYEYGVLTITPLPISIEMNTIEDVIYGDDLTYDLSNYNNYISSDSLANGEHLQVGIYVTQDENGVDAPLSISELNANTTYYIHLDVPSSFIYYDDPSKMATYTNNYDITYKASSFEVLARDILFTPIYSQTIYDYTGYEFIYNNVSYSTILSNINLYEGSSFATWDEVYVNVLYENIETNEVTSNPIDVGTYKVVFDSYSISSGNMTNGNYNISLYEDIDITINKRVIEITPIDQLYGDDNTISISMGHEYDANTYSYDNVSTENYVIVSPIDGTYVVPSMNIKVSFVDSNNVDHGNEITNADIYKLIIDLENITFAEGYDSNNYSIIYDNDNPVTITINPYEYAIDFDDLYETTYGDDLILSHSEQLLLEHEQAIITFKFYYYDEFNNLVEFTDNDGLPTDYRDGGYVVKVGSINYSEGTIISNYIPNSYDVDYEQATYNILRRPYNLITPDATKDYDGTELFNETLGSDDVENLVSEHYFKVVYHSSITYVGTIDNYLEIEIYDANDNNVSNNYYLDGLTMGVLEITPRPITLTTNNLTKDYDSTALESDGIATVGHSNVVSLPGLVLFDHVVIDGDTYSSIINVGQTENKYEYSICDGVGNDVTYCYDVTESWGTLKIDPRVIYVDPILVDINGNINTSEYNSRDVIYGEAIDNYIIDEAYKLDTDHQLLLGDQLMIKVWFEDLDGNQVVPSDAGTYYMIVDVNNYVVYDNYGIPYENPNYVIEQSGTTTYEITKRKLNVSVNSSSVKGREYNGEAFDKSKVGYTLGGSGLATEINTKKHTFATDYIYYDSSKNVYADDIINANTYYINIDKSKCVVTDSVGNDVTDNYDLIVDEEQYQELIIAKRKVTVKPNDVKKDYDKQEIIGETTFTHFSTTKKTDKGFIGEDASLFKVLAPHSFYAFDSEGNVIDTKINPINAGDYAIKFTEVEYEALTANYEISWLDSYGTLTINPIKITLKPIIEDEDGNNSRVYDGVSYSHNGDYEDVKDAILDGDTITIEVAFSSKNATNAYYAIDGNRKLLPGFKAVSYENLSSVVNASTYVVTIVGYTLNGQEFSGEDFNSGNYTIVTSSNITYTIEAKEISVSNGSYELTYNGQDQTPEYNISTANIIDKADRDFVEGLNQTVSFNSNSIEKYKNALPAKEATKQTVAFYDENGEPISNNYFVNLVQGTVMVHKRKLEITTNLPTNTKVYDSENFLPNIDPKKPDVDYSVYYTISGLAENERVSSLTWEDTKDQGVYSEYKVASFVVVNNKNVNVSANYEVDYKVRETFTINAKEISFTISEGLISEWDYDGKEVAFTPSDLLEWTGTVSNVKFDTSNNYVILDKDGNEVGTKISAAGTYKIVFTLDNILLEGEKALNNKNFIVDTDGITQYEIEITIKPYVLMDNGYTIVTPDASKFYDGNKLTNYNNWQLLLDGEELVGRNNTYTIEATGHTISVDTANLPFALLPGDEIDNKLVFIIKDTKGRIVTDNYVIYSEGNHTLGKLIINNELALSTTYSNEYGFTNEIAVGKVINGKASYVENGEEVSNKFTFTGKVSKVYDITDADVTSEKLWVVGNYKVELTEFKLYLNNRLIDEEATSKMSINGVVGSKSQFVQLEVTQHSIHIRPTDKAAEDYQGQIIKHASDEYEVVYGEYLGDLLPGHTLLITTDFTNINSGTLAKKAVGNISGYVIYDEDGNDVTSSYKVYTEYDSNCEAYKVVKEKLGVNISAKHYLGSISINSRQVEVTPISGGQNFEYNGGTHSLDYTDASDLYTYIDYEDSILKNSVSEDMYGLLPGHSIDILTTVVSLNPGTYTNWLKLAVYDENGNNVTLGYRFTYTPNIDSKVTVYARNLQVAIYDDVTLYAGKVLDESEYTIKSGSLVGDDLIRITVTSVGPTVAESRFDVKIFFEVPRPDGSIMEKSNTSKYSVNFISTHALTYHEAVEKTCENDGNIEHWTCDGCDKYFLDSEGTQETTAASVVISSSHDLIYNAEVPATNTTSGTKEHWYCEDCGEYYFDEACTNKAESPDDLVIEALG